MSKTKEQLTKELTDATNQLEGIMADLQNMVFGPADNINVFISILQSVAEKRDSLYKKIDDLKEKLKNFI
jgi:hypothetical protein